MRVLLKSASSLLAPLAVPLLAKADLAWMFLPALLIGFVSADAFFGLLPAARSGARDRLLHRAPLWFFIPLQLTLIAWGAVASRGGGVAQLVALATDIGVTTGIFGMLAAHEMIHSRHAAERALGLAMLAPVGYMHFRIAHIHFHHRLAATAEDPATARRGEGAYCFMLRSILGQWRQARDYERRRTARASYCRSFDRTILYPLASIAIAAALSTALGMSALLFVAIHAAVAVLILELFNYVAHYGLLRHALPGGRTEPLGPRHSWNARQRFTNWILFNGGHHSHHHRRPTASHQRLQPWPAAPLLPAGYAATFCLALVPPLWRKVMDPRVAAVGRGSGMPSSTDNGPRPGASPAQK